MILWAAEYDNGSTISELSDGRVMSASELDRNKLRSFRLELDGKLLLTLSFGEDKPHRNLIFRRRRRIGSDGTFETITIVGWSRDVICYVREDGSIELDGDRGDLVLLDSEMIY